MDLYKSSRQFVSKIWSPPAIKYHGLENQGSTCYLNSMLQVLFMTKDFREAVEGYTSANPDSEHIDLQLESLFGDLKSYPAYTHKITKKLGINNVYEQQDAAEYFEKILAKTSDDASKIFQGQLTHKTTCSSCGTETDAAGPFWHLPLALEDSYSRNYSVVNGIEKYFRENWMHCKKCDDKSDATSKCVINHHPEVLMLLLKRFEFDNRSMRYVKNNCTVDVPCTLQIPENQPYELYAMVEHSGDLRSGHYIAKIKSEDDGRWYSFNDRWVTELPSQPFQSDKVEKSSSAYLLFYRKKKAIKYHGLENQGSTCYLNSVLQVLFMTKDFREAVERLPSENTEHIDLQLQSLFGDLKSRTAKTNDITKKLGIQDVHVNQDAEYFEKILALTSPEASQLFHGLLTHKTICSACGAETSTDKGCWHLPLALVDSQNFNVEKGIEEYFRASHLNGENQMYCDECDDRSDATTKCVIKHHPEVLMLLLKRFEFDYRCITYVKINCTVDIPCTLEIPENQPYELYAMVEHSGDLRSGHYIATIKSEDDGRWYSFNDKNVTLLDSQPFQSDKVEKSSSAYLLFYRKEKVPAAGTQDQSPAERREREREAEEAEGTAEEGKDAAATAFIDRDEGRGIKDKARVTSRKPGLSPDISNAESKEGQQKMWQANGADVEQQGDGLRTETDVDVDKERNTDPSPLIDDRRVDGRKQYMSKDRQGFEARRRSRERDRRDIDGAKEQKRGDDKHAQRTKPYLWEGGEDQDRRGLDGVRQQKASVPHVPLEDVDEERPADAQRRERDVKTDKSGGDEQSEQSGTSLTKKLYRDTEHHGNEALGNIKHDNLEGQQKMQQANGPDVEQQGDGLRREQDVDVDKERNTDPSPLIDDRRVDGRKHYMSKDRQGFEARRRSRDRRQLREDRRDIEGAKEQKRGDDKHVQRTETSMTEDQDRRGLDGVRQQRTSVPYLTPEDVDEERPADAQRRERDVKTDKSGGDEQSEQSGTSLTEKLYRETEHHGNEGLGNVKHDNLEGQQKMQQANGPDVEQQGDGLRREQDVDVDKERNTDPSPLIDDRRVDGRKHYMSKDRQGFEARRRSRDRRQPREDRRDIEGAKEQKRGDDKDVQRTETSMTEDQDRRGLDDVRQQRTSVPYVTPEDVDEERPAKEQERKPFPNRGDSSRKQLIVKTVGEETIKTSFGTQRSIETKIIGIKTREKPAQQERLSFIFSDMKLSERQKPGTKRHIVNVPTSAIDSNAERKPKVSDTQEQAAESQHAMKEIGEEEIKSRGHHALKEKNRNGKKKKITKQIFKLWKHADQTSESD